MPHAHRLKDSVRDLLGVVVLPDPDHEPASIFEEKCSLPVSFSIGVDLGFPPRSVALRRFPVLGTPVPEATIDKYGDLGRANHDVGAPRNVRLWPAVYPVAKPSSVQ